MKMILAIVVSYFLGSVPVGYLVARFWKGIDIRSYGSGNIGATNVWRAVGPVPGALALLGDAAKGYLAVMLARQLGRVEIEVLAALAVLAGHGWSVFLKFKGGKMIATGLGVLLAISLPTTLTGFGIWVMVVGLTRYVSLGSITAVALLPFIMSFYGLEWHYLIFGSFFAAFAIFKHRSNIERLLSGRENKIVWRKP